MTITNAASPSPNEMPSASGNPATASPNKQSAPSDAVRDAFQKFVAGTFYKQMMKAMRKMHDKPAYFHGGQAEEMFQSQMDQYVAEDLSAKHGAALAEPLFKTFSANLSARSIARPKNAALHAVRVGESDPAGTISRQADADTLTESAIEARLVAAKTVRS